MTIGGSTTVTQTAVTVPQVVFSTSTREVTVPNDGGKTVTQTMTQGVGLIPFMQTTAPPAGPSGGPGTPVAGSTFAPSTTGNGGRPGASASGSKTGGSPIQTFTGAAVVNEYSVVAGGLALLAFLV